MVIEVFQRINGQYSRIILLFLLNQLKSQIPTNDQSSHILSSNLHAEYFYKVDDSNIINNNDNNDNDNNSKYNNDNDDNNNNIDIQARILHLKQIYKAGQIDEIKANVFRSFLYDEKRIFCFVVEGYISKSIKSDFENKSRALKAEIKHNIIQRDDPNDVCTYFIFQSYFGIIQFKDYINQIMTKNKYKDDNLIGNTLYMHFDEKMIPSKGLPAFIRYLESIHKIKDIQKKIFDFQSNVLSIESPIQRNNYLYKIVFSNNRVYSKKKMIHQNIFVFYLMMISKLFQIRMQQKEPMSNK
ncbi:hypothetical protein M9Y10_011191 [Tritrichomonas musculus]|uniref:Uncharacterized protein n=1 Tax=Tritrichomonas musculus TaxID=1915356 RepID=A0ABR2IJJ9_9EUKA